MIAEQHKLVALVLAIIQPAIVLSLAHIIKNTTHRHYYAVRPIPQPSIAIGPVTATVSAAQAAPYAVHHRTVRLMNAAADLSALCGTIHVVKPPALNNRL